MSAKSTMFNLKVTHGQFCHELQVPSTATFGDVKQILVEDTMLQPSEQRLLVRGREVADAESLIEAGVKNGMKLMLLENLAAKERKEEEMNKAVEDAKASSAIAQIHMEVNNYQSQVQELRDTVSCGVKVDEKQFAITSELLMRQLLKLDGIDAEGEVKQQRRNEVKRVQQLVDEVDRLKGMASLAGSLPPASVISSTTENGSVQAAVLNALARHRLSQAPPPSISTAPEAVPLQRPNEIPPSKARTISINTDWETFDAGNRMLSPSVLSPRARNVFLRTSQQDEPALQSNDQARQSMASQSPRGVRPPGLRNTTTPGVGKPSSNGQGPGVSTSSQQLLGQSSTSQQPNIPRRSISLENLSVSPSPPASPASTARSSLRSSRSSTQITTPSLADSISTFPPMAIPKGAVGSPRSKNRKVRPAVLSPSDVSRSSSNSSGMTLSTFHPTSQSHLAAGSKTSNNDDSPPAREELSTFPPSAVPHAQSSGQLPKPVVEKIRRSSGSSRPRRSGNEDMRGPPDLQNKPSVSRRDDGTGSPVVLNTDLGLGRQQGPSQGLNGRSSIWETTPQPQTHKSQIQGAESLDLISFTTELPFSGPSVSPLAQQDMLARGLQLSPQNGLLSSQRVDTALQVQSPSDSLIPELLPSSPVLSPHISPVSLNAHPSGPQALTTFFPMTPSVSGQEHLRFSDTNPFAQSLPRTDGFSGSAISSSLIGPTVSLTPHAGVTSPWEKFD